MKAGRADFRDWQRVGGDTDQIGLGEARGTVRLHALTLSHLNEAVWRFV
jgi:hypothetical protein